MPLHVIDNFMYTLYIGVQIKHLAIPVSDNATYGDDFCQVVVLHSVNSYVFYMASLLRYVCRINMTNDYNHLHIASLAAFLTHSFMP